MKKTTVIIPTYNGKNKIIHALASLAKQTLLPDEVVIVVDGSTDGTADMLKKMSLYLPNCKIIEQENRGRAAVRNRGASESSSELLLFLDDDMTVPEHWVQSHCKHHDRHPGTLMSGHLVSPPILSKNDFHHYRTWLGEKWNKDIELSTTNSGPLNTPYITANNFSIEKTTFIKIGGFDERLLDLEDYDLALRATQMAFDIYVDKDAYAVNADTGIASCDDYIKRLRAYRLAKIKLIELKPEMYKEDPNFIDSKLGIKKIIYRLLAHSFWIKCVDRGLLIWLPQSLRYKIYNAILHSSSVVYPDKASLTN
jgi:glycosyltransferase involved in cell wall biosynthesis